MADAQHRSATPAAVLPSQSNLVAERIVAVGVALALVAVVGQTVVGLVNGLAFDGRYIQLDLDREFNVFSWASSAATFAAAFAALLAAVALDDARARWATLAALLAFFSADDLLVLHERLTRRLFVDVLGLPVGLGSRLFAVLYLPLLLAAFLILVGAARAASGRPRRALAAGLGCLVVAVLLELVNGTLSALDRITFRSDEDVILVTFEEGLELAGWTLIAAALAALVAAGLVERGAREGTSPSQSGRS